METTTYVGFPATRPRVESPRVVAGVTLGVDRLPRGRDARLVPPMKAIHNTTGVSATRRRRT